MRFHTQLVIITVAALSGLHRRNNNARNWEWRIVLDDRYRTRLATYGTGLIDPGHEPLKPLRDSVNQYVFAAPLPACVQRAAVYNARPDLQDA